MKTQNRNLPVSWLFLCISMMASLYAQTETKAIWAGQMIDVINAELIDDVIIVVEEGKIKNIVPAQKKDAFTDLIDLSGYTVLPGLIDCHTHLTSPSFDRSIDVYELPIASYGILGANYAKTTLLSGFTTVRDVGGVFYSDVALRDAINKGWTQGPRMYVSGKALTITGGHGAWANWLSPQLTLHPNPGNPVDGEAEVRKATRGLIKNGVDLIKINATGGFGTSNSIPGAASFTISEMRAAVEEANKRGLKVAAHAHGADGIMNAVKAGVHSIEHGTFLDQESIDLMKKNKIYLVMDLLAAYVDLIEKNEDYGDKQLKKGNEEIYRDLEKTFFKAYSQGVLISFGTDASIFKHGRNAEQYALMLRAGMIPKDIIRSTTIQAAKLIGIEQKAGSIEIGKWADLIAVKGNPLEDITVLENPFFVMKGGKVYKHK